MSDMKDGAEAPRLLNDASILKQLGLDNPTGMQRLIMMLVSKLDPNCAGVELTQEDVTTFVNTVADGRNNLAVVGKGTSIHLRLCNKAETDQVAAMEKQQQYKRRFT